jgi:HK97 family phage major capsid protein
VGAFSDVSRRLLLQSSMDVEAFIRSELATTLALEIDRAAINGSGSSNQPTGILNVSGIGAVAGGTNGAAPDWADIVDLESAVSVDNADMGALGYLTNASVRGKLLQTEKASSTGQYVWGEGNTLRGYNAAVSNQVPSNLTKGSGTGLSAILFGNWNDLIIGTWGGIDINIDTSTGSASGTVRVVALQDVDIAVRHAESFAAMQDAIT